MLYNYIIFNNKNINIKTKQGKLILKKYIKQIGSGNICECLTNKMKQCKNNKNKKFKPFCKKHRKCKKKINDEKIIENILDKSNIYSPKKYFDGLNIFEVKKRLKRIKEGSKSSSKDKEQYREFETDYRNGKIIKTKLSNYTKQWNNYFPNAKS